VFAPAFEARHLGVGNRHHRDIAAAVNVLYSFLGIFEYIKDAHLKLAVIIL